MLSEWVEKLLRYDHARFHMFWCILASDHDGSEAGGES